MKALLIKLLAASGLLNLISLIEVETMETPIPECPDTAGCISVTEKTKGFPLSYIEETNAATTTTSVDWASLASNWIFWAIIAVVGFFVLRWIWDKFSRMVFYFIIAIGIFLYIGSLEVW